MPYLIDGNNLIGYIPHLSLDDLQSKSRLVAQLLIFQQVKKSKIILVFDGPPDLALFGKEFRGKKFSILYPAFDQTADTLIQELILKQTDRRHFMVVSSDREIRAFTRLQGAKSISCQEFYRQLKAVLKGYRENQSMKKNDRTLSSLEVDHWLDIFDPK